MIRLAQPGDAAAILAIYAPYIRDTSLNFETVVPSVEDFTARIASYLEYWPWLVSEEQGQVTGYAYGSRYRERTGYQWCVEASVYIAADRFGSGIASKLYTALFSILQKQGYINVYAVINLPNERSVNFHEKMGFRYFASFEKVGYKLGAWKDVGWWQLSLNEYIDEPAVPLKFSELDKSRLSELEW